MDKLRRYWIWNAHLQTSLEPTPYVGWQSIYLASDLAERRKQAREAVMKELAVFRERCVKGDIPFLEPCAGRIDAICFGEEP